MSLRSRMTCTVAIAAVVAAGVPAGALGHASLVGTSPAAGSVVPRLPATVTIRFDQALGAVNSVQLTSGANHVARAGLDPRDARRVVVKTTRPVAGRYQLRWTVVATDGHRQQGTVSFRARRA
jgi:methionine-rich copper-binding protein CopC